MLTIKKSSTSKRKAKIAIEFFCSIAILSSHLTNFMTATRCFQMQTDYKNYQSSTKFKDGRQTILDVWPRLQDHVLIERIRLVLSCLCHGSLVVIVTSRPKSKMAMSDVDVSSSLDQDEDPLAELTDEELFNLVQETL